MRTCKINGCDKKHHAKGLCERHYRRQWYKDRAEKVREYARQYRKDNAEKIRERKRQYQKDNAELERERKRRYRARKNNLEGEVTVEDERFLFSLMPVCLVCGTEEELALDHVIPIARKDGKPNPLSSNYPINMQVLCKSHNSSKGNYHTTDYRTDEIREAILAYSA